MLQLIDVKKLYISGETQTAALNGVSLTIQEGEYVSITGPSGCGKSTLLSILGLLDTPDSGKCSLMGQEVSRWSEAKLNKLRAGRIGFIFQSFNLIEELSVSENVELGLRYIGISQKERRDRVANMLGRLKIEHRANHRPSQLSGGQQQRVAIARALAPNPKILLADEPTGNLDSFHGEEVMELLREINLSGTSVVMVTHSSSQAAQAHRTIQMLDGKIHES